MEGDCYPGDLLVAMLGAAPDFWAAHSQLRARLDALVLAIEYDLQQKHEVLEKNILPAWRRIYGSGA